MNLELFVYLRIVVEVCSFSLSAVSADISLQESVNAIMSQYFFQKSKQITKLI